MDPLVIAAFLLALLFLAHLRRFRSNGVVVRSWVFGLDHMWLQGNALRNSQFVHFMKKREDKYGDTYQINMLGHPTIVTNDKENIKAVLAAQFKEYGKGPDFQNMAKDVFGRSILSTDGEIWHFARGVLRVQFMKERLRDVAMFDKHTTRLLAKVTPGEPLDLLKELYKFTTDTGTDFLLGQSVENLLSPTEDPFSKALGFVQDHFAQRTLLGKWWRILPTTGEYKRSLETINNFLEPFIQQALAIPVEELRDRGDKELSFLELLACESQDHEFLRDQILSIHIGARDTTACTLLWAFYLLSTKPAAYQKLRKEVLSVVGVDGLPDSAALHEMRFLNRVINEILRLRPTIPVNIRNALVDTTLPRGGGKSGDEPIHLQKGTSIMYSAYALHRNTHYHTMPDLEDFDPDRWEKWTPPTWSYLPWNGGPRICVGQAYAMHELKFVISRFVQRFSSIESFPQCDVHSYAPNAILQPTVPTLIKFHAGGDVDELAIPSL